MLQLEISLATEPVLAGTAMPARVTLRNSSTSALDLPGLGVPSALEFVILDDAGNLVVMFQGDGTARTVAPLDPGAELTLEVDVQRRLVSSLEPGRYQLLVALRQDGATLANARTSLSVASLTPEAVVRQAGAEGAWLASFVAHRRSDGSRALFYSFWDAVTPYPGALQPVVELPVGPSVTLALAPRSLATPAGAWLASLSQALIVGRTAAEPANTASTEVFPPVGAQGRLLRGAATLPDGGFLAAILGADGATLTVVRTDPTGHSAFTPLALGASVPQLASAVMATASDGDDLQAHLWWIEGARSVHRLSLVASAPTEFTLTPGLYASGGRIVAIQANPPDGVFPTWVHVLEVASAAPSRAMLLRFHPVTGQEVDRAELPELPAAAGSAQSWLLPSSGVSANGPIVATAASGAWLLRDGVWEGPRRLGGDARNAELVSFANRLWLSAWSPDTGVELTDWDAPPNAR